MTLLSYTNRTIYSASVNNNWQRSAFDSYAKANMERACFNGVAKDYGADTFYLYYTGDTNIVHYAISDSVTFTINGVDYAMTVGDGTFTVSGLTAHTVYEVTTARADSYTAVYWLGFQISVGNTAAPTFTDLTVPTAADFSDMYDSLSEAEISAELLIMPHAYSLIEGASDYRDVWHGGFIAGQDDLDFNIYTSGDGSGMTVRLSVLIGGIEQLNTVYTEAAQTNDVNIDLSALSLTAGSVYRLQIRLRGEGGSATPDFKAKLNTLYTSNATAAITPEVEYSRGDTVTAAALTNMKSCLDVAHPNNGTSPLPVDVMAQRIVDLDDTVFDPSDYYRTKHINGYLRYSHNGGADTPQIQYNGGDIDLSTDTGTHVYDLNKLSDLADGEYYKVSNCKFAFEDVTDA